MKTLDSLLSSLYWLFSLIYTWHFWGWGWGLVSIIFPIFPLIDIAKYAVFHL